MVEPTRELLKVIHNGRIEPSEYTEDYIDVGLRRRRILKDRLYSMIQAGATLVVNRIELVSHQVREVCVDVGKFVGAQTTSNAYACMGEDPATNPHWDTHDVFVLQVGGRKHWKIYEPTFPLPISSQISNDHKNDLPEVPYLDEVLEEGDILYVPRGWWHRVAPVKGDHTIHLTVAIHTPLILDYVIWASASVLPGFVDMRQSLSGSADDPDRIEEALAVMREALRSPETLQRFYARSQERERVISPFNIETLLSGREQELHPGTRLTLNTRHCTHVSGRILVNGSELKLPDEAQRVVEILRHMPRPTIDEISGKLPAMRRQRLETILRMLALHDVVTLSSPNPSEGAASGADFRKSA